MVRWSSESQGYVEKAGRKRPPLPQSAHRDAEGIAGQRCAVAGAIRRAEEFPTKSISASLRRCSRPFSSLTQLPAGQFHGDDHLERSLMLYQSLLGRHAQRFRDEAEVEPSLLRLLFRSHTPTIRARYVPSKEGLSSKKKRPAFLPARCN